MIRDEFVMQLSAISSTNYTVHRRINDISAYILGQVIQEIKSSPFSIFSIKSDEFTDAAPCPQLLVFVKYISYSDFKDEFLFCKKVSRKNN